MANYYNRDYTLGLARLPEKVKQHMIRDINVLPKE
jgi:hypothetical protein